MPERVDITQDELMTLLVNFLRAELGLNESRCYETERPDVLPRIPSGSDYSLTVSMGDGTFPIEEQAPEQCNEEFDVTVMAWVRINLDAPNADTMLLHEAKRGTLPIKKLILQALCGEDTRRENGDYFLRSLLSAKRSIAPAAYEQKAGTVAGVGIVFNVSFDWDLSGE